MLEINDKIVWECLKDNNVINIAKNFGYKEEKDYTRWNEIHNQMDSLLSKHGLDPNNCFFNEEILGEDDYYEYCKLDKKCQVEERRLNKEYVDKCIDWLMENGYGVKVVNEKNEIIYCKDCKWWKDSNGVDAKSKCPMNTKVVYEGIGYCYMAERG